MENLKIRVTTPGESERAQRAFFALGYKWPSIDLESPKSIEAQYGIFSIYREKALSSCLFEKTFINFIAKEITIHELEKMAAKAAHGEGLNSFEMILPPPNDNESEEQASEAQKRYEAARGIIDEWGYDEFWVDKALRVAAGLE